MLKSAESPPPGVWTVEILRDLGTTFEPWRYFAPSLQDCLKHFGLLASHGHCVTTAEGKHHTNEQVHLFFIYII